MKGEANSSVGIILGLSYKWGKGPWGKESGLGVGWTKYRKAHPVYIEKVDL